MEDLWREILVFYDCTLYSTAYRVPWRKAKSSLPPQIVHVLLQRALMHQKVKFGS
jgi:hypothetical protein